MPAVPTASGRLFPHPRTTLAWTLVAAACAVVSVILPVAGIGLVIVLAIAVAVRNIPLMRMAAPVVAATAVAAVAGPNLALPQAPWLFLFRILIVLVGLVAVAWLILGRPIRIPGPVALPGQLLVVWFGWSVLSIGWAGDVVAAARWSLFLAMMGGLALAIPLVFGTRRRAIRLLYVLLITFVVVGLTSAAEIVLGIRLPTSRLAGKSAETAFGATSVFRNENNLATYLTLTLPYFLVLPVVFGDIRLRVLGISGSGIALVALLFTGSKANLIAMALILVGLMLFLGTDLRMRGRVLSAVLVVVAAVALVVPAVQGSGVVKLPERAVTKFDFSLLAAQRDAGTGSGAVRSSLLTDGLDLVGETGGIGVGAGNAESSVRSLAEFPGVANMHNWWLEVLVDGGLIALALYVCFFVHLLTRQLRVARRTADPFVRYMALSGALALTGFIAGSLGPSTVIHFAPMWITFGLGMLALVLGHRAAQAGGRLP